MDIFTTSEQRRLYTSAPWEPLLCNFKQYKTLNLNHKCSHSAQGNPIHQIHLLLLFTEASSQKASYRSNLKHLKNISDGFFSSK